MSEQTLSMLPLDALVYSGRNPRQEFRDIEELAENLKIHGVLQPIIVRPKEEKFEVVVGERRVRASIQAGLKEIPAIIRPLTDHQTDELRLIENVHRDDLTNAEKGEAVMALWERYPEQYLTFKSIADSLNVKYDTLKMWIRYSRRLSDFVKEGVISSTLGEDHARFLLKYDQSTQDRLARAILKNELNTTQTRQFLKLYDSRSEADLDDLALEAKGIKRVAIPLEKLSEEAKKEVERVLEEEKKEIAYKPAPEIRERISETLRETVRRKKAREKMVDERKVVSLSSFMEEGKPFVLEKVEEITPSPVQEIPEHVEQLTREVTEQIRETISQAPEKAERVSEIVSEELRGMRKRLEIFPEKSKKIEPKFEKFETLIDRGVIPYTIWDFQYRDDYAGDKDFHGNCSPQIVEQCIWRLTEEGDLVVDPMAGSGTALDVCKKFNRKCIGYDIKPLESRPDIIQNDSRKIPLESESVDMIFIHPPYWNLTYYTKTEENLPDLSRAKNVDAFIDMLEQVFRECHRILKPDKFMCVLLGDLIREGRFVPLCRMATNIAEKIGFIDYGYAVKLAHGEVSRKKSGVIVAEPMYKDNLKISHDLVIFLRKPEGNGN